MIAFAIVLSLVQAADPATATQPTPQQKEAFLRVLRRVSAFAEGKGRELGSVRLGMMAPDSEGKAFIVEFGWKEKGAQRTGIASFIDEAALRARSPEAVPRALARDGGWVLMNVIEDKTWDDLIKGLADSRRSADESAAVGDIRTVISAQAIYKSVVNAYAPTLACLGRPADCIPGYKGPSDFLSGWLVTGEDHMGYRRALQPGRKAVVKTGARAVETWAYTAVPAAPEKGWRAFCGDYTGVVCAVVDGTMPPINGGACPRTCQPVK